MARIGLNWWNNKKAKKDFYSLKANDAFTFDEVYRVVKKDYRNRHAIEQMRLNNVAKIEKLKNKK